MAFLLPDSAFLSTFKADIPQYSLSLLFVQIEFHASVSISGLLFSFPFFGLLLCVAGKNSQRLIRLPSKSY